MDFISTRPDFQLIDNGYFIRYYDGVLLTNLYGSSLYYYDTDHFCLKEHVYKNHSITNSLGTIEIVKNINEVYLKINGRISRGFVNSSSEPYIIKSDSYDDIRVDTNFGTFSYNYNNDTWNKISKSCYNNVHIRGDYSYILNKNIITITFKGVFFKEITLPNFISCGFGNDYFVMKDKLSNLLFWKF
jgi:hypothetical protein